MSESGGNDHETAGPVAAAGTVSADEELVAVAMVETERLAREAAKRLLEKGIGAVVALGVPPELADLPPPPTGTPPRSSRDTDEHAALFELRVMRHQVVNACAVLGVDPPDAIVQEKGAAAEKTYTPWKRMLVIWAIALVTIPPAAGYLAYLILSR